MAERDRQRLRARRAAERIEHLSKRMSSNLNDGDEECQPCVAFRLSQIQSNIDLIREEYLGG